MTAVTAFPSTNQSTGFLRMAAIALAIALLAGVAAGVAGHVSPVSHAVLKHGSDATLARQCLNGNQQFFVFKNPNTHRVGTVCEVNGLWGIVILDEDGNEITAFIKNKMSRFEQVVSYMKNAGYSLIH